MDVFFIDYDKNPFVLGVVFVVIFIDDVVFVVAAVLFVANIVFIVIFITEILTQKLSYNVRHDQRLSRSEASPYD